MLKTLFTFMLFAFIYSNFSLINAQTSNEQISNLYLSINNNIKDNNFNEATNEIIRLINWDNSQVIAKNSLIYILMFHENELNSKFQKNALTIIGNENFFMKDNKLQRNLTTMSLVCLYYRYSMNDLLDILLEELKNRKANNLNINTETLTYLDPQINYEEYKKILNIFTFNDTNINSIQLLIIAYNIDNQNLSSETLNKIKNIDYNNINKYLDRLLNLDPSIDSSHYYNIFKGMVSKLNDDIIDNYSKKEDQFKFSKLLFLGGNVKDAYKILDRIYKSITPNINTYRDYFYFGISCLSQNDKSRAKSFFDQLKALGTESDRNFLKDELLWMNKRNFFPDFVPNIITEYYSNTLPNNIVHNETKKEENNKVTDLIPEVKLTEPYFDSDNEYFTNTSSIKIKGYLINGDNILRLYFNRILGVLLKDNTFFSDINLVPGLNTIKISTDINAEQILSTVNIYLNVDSICPQIILSDKKFESNSFTTDSRFYKISGYIKERSGIKELRINNKLVPVDSQNHFSESIILKEGINKIQLTAENSNGIINKVKKYITVEKYNTGPKITLLEPTAQRGIKIVNKSDVIKIKGIAEDEDGILNVTVNGEEALLKEDGEFGANRFLEVGDNQLIITATDKKYAATIDTFIVTRRLEDVIKNGKFYAFIIGIDNYEGYWPKLKSAVNDAEAVSNILKKQYDFDKIINLYNSNATREEIYNKFEWLVNNLTTNDNLLIYYAGHGQFNKILSRGYWVPIDAKTNSVASFIPNTDIKNFIAAIPAKHSLLITDACFSGDIFRGVDETDNVKFDPNNMQKYYREVYRKKSRLALTSGGLEEVADQGKDGHSIFAYYLLEALKNNNKKYIDIQQLFNEFKISVVNNSEQTPQLQVLRDTYDEGGQFIFIHK